MMKRRDIVLGLASLTLPIALASCSDSKQVSSSNPTDQPNDASKKASSSGSKKIRIGYQRFSDLDIIRTRGDLDKRLKEQGLDIDWTFFQSGPPMLEAMNTGSLDWGVVGDTPPIFAQAAGTQFYYLGRTLQGPKTQDIVVLKDSPIQTAADLKGKKVALQKGSSAHYLLISTLRNNNVPIETVDIVSLSPSDARAAFEQGKVDAWAIWDPFLAVIEQTGKVRKLNLGQDRSGFILASQKFVQEQPDLVKRILQETKTNQAWAQQNTKAIAQQFAQQLGIEAATLEIVTDRRKWELTPIDDAVIASQQQVADTFYKLKIIPKAIQVKDVTLPLERYKELFPA